MQIKIYFIHVVNDNLSVVFNQNLPAYFFKFCLKFWLKKPIMFSIKQSIEKRKKTGQSLNIFWEIYYIV